MVTVPKNIINGYKTDDNDDLQLIKAVAFKFYASTHLLSIFDCAILLSVKLKQAGSSNYEIQTIYQ